jgi:mannosyltransferase OCH1-like enzyme
VALWHRRFIDMVSTIIAVSRTLWDETGGFDEGFRGWGWEDNAFAAMCETFGSGQHVLRMEGDAWHLWHAAAPEVGKHHPLQVANRQRYERYHAVKGDKARIRALRDDPAVDVFDPKIPRVLHRTVPEVTSPVVERWWAEWAELHPGWRMMTHRDPLDPKDWPLTSRAWRHVKVGAQLADLVRLEALFRWGGFYVDSDIQPVRSLEPLRLVGGAIAAWEDERCVPNAFLAAPPGHDAIKAALDLCVHRTPKGDVWKAGPGVTTELFRERDDVLLLPPGTFYPVHYRDPERDAKMRDFDPAAHPWTYGIHWYAASWLPEKDQHPLEAVA